MEKLHLVHFSATGTTKTIAAALAKGLNREIAEYDLLRNPLKDPTVFDEGVPTIVAMPVYAGRIPAVCVDMLQQIKGSQTPAVAVVVYGNRDYDDALLELCDIVSANGFTVVAAAAFVAQHSIFPTVGRGRPDEKDDQWIASFAKKCETAFLEFTGAEQVTVKGHAPYCEPSAIPLRPSASSKCNACGTCAKICPTKAISPDALRKTDKARCISCAACIAACPQQARAFRGPLYAVAGKAFYEKNSARREPEFFFPAD